MWGHTPAMTYMWRLEGNFVELALYLNVVSGDLHDEPTLWPLPSSGGIVTILPG